MPVKDLYIIFAENIYIMEKKIIERLSVYGLKPSDLTEEELNMLKEEIKTEEEGGFILDGVLFNPEIQQRAFKRQNDLK